MSFECYCAKIITDNDEHLRFAGYKRLPEDRLRLEVRCNRPDEHELKGTEHWYENHGVKIAWSIPIDAVPMGAW